MNERIKELYLHAFPPSLNDSTVCRMSAEKFAEMIVKECAKVAWYHTPDTEELEYSHLIEDKILKHFGVK
jgi:hypothetical protein